MLRRSEWYLKPESANWIGEISLLPMLRGIRICLSEKPSISSFVFLKKKLVAFSMSLVQECGFHRAKELMIKPVAWSKLILMLTQKTFIASLFKTQMLLRLLNLTRSELEFFNSAERCTCVIFPARKILRRLTMKPQYLRIGSMV